MNKDFIKECYNDNPHYKLHYTLEKHPKNSTPPHLHYDTSLVVTCFLKGSGSVYVEGKVYPVNAGDLIMLNPNEIHLATIDDVAHERISLYIFDTILDSFQCGKHRFFDSFYTRANGTNNVIHSSIVKSAGIITQLNKIVALNRENTIESSVLATCAIIEFLATLNQLTESLVQNDLITSVSNKQINAIIKYLSENYTQKINIDELAEKFHFNKHYLCRTFKKYTGTTIVEYCTFKKIIAFNQLICNNLSSEDASYQVGFHNYSNFYRQYKKYMGMTPTEYKRSRSNK